MSFPITRENVLNAISKLAEDRIAVSLMLTAACPYECGHCMYACKPSNRKAYMTTQTVLDIKQAALECAQLYTLTDSEYGPNLSINLVGGEPTMNVDEFSRIFSLVEDNDFSLEMTTNGWWLENREALVKVARLISTSAITVRISSSVYHDAHRSTQLRRILNSDKTFKAALMDVTEFHDLWEVDSSVCPDCGKRPYDSEDDVCDCGYTQDDITQRLDNSLMAEYDGLSRLNSKITNCELYVDRQDKDRVNSVGRAETNNLAPDRGDDSPHGGCFTASPTFSPSGWIHGPCSSGRQLHLGKASDGAAAIIACQLYVDWMQSRRCDCRTSSEVWKENRYSIGLIDKIKSIINELKQEAEVRDSHSAGV